MLGGSIEHKFGKNEWERNEDVVQEYHERIGSRIILPLNDRHAIIFYFTRDNTGNTHCFLVSLRDFGPPISLRYPVVNNRRGSRNILVRSTRNFCLRSWSEIGLLVGLKGLEKEVVSLTDTRTCPARRPPLNWFLAPLFSKQKQLSHTTSYER